MTTLESSWIVEVDIRASRATTTHETEFGPCSGVAAEETAGAAWTDGSNWLDSTGEVGWVDFPPAGLLGGLVQS